jgi:DNA helicase-2/ATP-dependent DNA helicase PcrA
MSELNDQQKHAVETIDGPLLIIAGAGAGKTKVITHRIANIIRCGMAPSNILAVTFTNKAAKEMRERINHILSTDKTLNNPISNLERPFVSTFHALGVHIIRENANLIGLNRHFSIYDRGDSKRAIKDAMEQCSIDPKKFEPGTVLNIISRAKGDGLNYIEYRDTAKGYAEEIVSKIWEKYDALVLKDKALDFDDLLVKTKYILEKFPEVRKKYSNIWKYIHIDEYQDTNKVQYQIVKLLTNEHKNICVVGDIDQNIYSWRGASIDNILNFEKDYPEATVVTLEKNYRSTKTILAVANGIIEKNKMRRKKNLYTENEHGEKVSLAVSYTEADEARNIADSTKELIENGVKPSEIAILYRANFQSRILEEYFLKKNIPYQMLGTKFFDRSEIKTVISYIKASLNRDSWADISRIINVPPCGVGKVTIAKIMAKQENTLPDSMREKVNSFWRLLDKIQNYSKENKVSELVRYIIQESGFEKLLMNGDTESEERLLNVRELVSVATQYDDLGQVEGLETFLTNSALATDQDEMEKPQEKVKLMTIHASKGLEFDHVFITGLEQDLFPFKHVDDTDIDEKEEEEERRLFYVAITRAKKQLHLSHTLIRTIYGAQRLNTPSEFLQDIDPKYIKDSVQERPTGAKAIFIDF